MKANESDKMQGNPLSKTANFGHWESLYGKFRGFANIAEVRPSFALCGVVYNRV